MAIGKDDSFLGLDPDFILESTEKLGVRATGELRQLNSYENRVFEVNLESPIPETDIQRVVIKFYRPGRWTREMLEEEHKFLLELEDQEVPVVAPLEINGRSLLQHKGLFYTLFPKVWGRMPDEILADDVKRAGVLLAQVHNIGDQSVFRHRPVMGQSPLTPWNTLERLQDWVSVEMWPRYEATASELIHLIEEVVDPDQFQRIHGDFHRGNLISNRDGFLLVDFDDCMMGPVIQDFWMILKALEPDQANKLIIGYESLREFPEHQLSWIPLLQGLRIMNYAGWIAQRWEDPFFKKTFPQFGEYTYWAEETEALEKALRAFETEDS